MIPSKRLLLPLLASLALPGMAFACTPAAPSDDAGFYRNDVGHLPRNARGVMFFAPGHKLKASDFSITSPDDRRPLALRLNRLRDGVVRLEPAGGFAPRAHYTFAYLPKHTRWRFADTMRVAIDDAVIDTNGDYAIELAPQPQYRMIEVVGSPACTQSVVAVAQPFAYRVPAALAPYRAVLEYASGVQVEPRYRQRFPEAYEWPYRLTTYYGDVVWRDRKLFGGRYTPADDIAVTGCGHQPLRGTLRGSVAFPEVDDRRHRIAPVAIDLGRPARGECRPLDALTGTMGAEGADQGLRAACGKTLRYQFDPATRPPGSDTELWEYELSFLYDLSPTCALVTLTRALGTRRYVADRAAMAQLGAGLEKGLRIAEAPQTRQAVDGLHYLAQQLPDDRRTDVHALLAPLLPRLAAALAEPEPYRPDALATLIVRAGKLPPDVRARLEAVARGRTAGAPHARAILAARP